MCACVVEKRNKDSAPEHSGFVLPEQEECATAHGPGGKGGGKSLISPLLVSDNFIDLFPLFFLSHYSNLKPFTNMLK